MSARWLRACAAIILLATMGLAHAQPPAQEQAQAAVLQPVPPLAGRVIDATGTLSAPDRAALDGKLAALERDKGAQVVVLMVPTTAPEDIAAYANRVGNVWKIGRKSVGDGLIVLVAKDDRRVRIEVAKTLEGAVPDIAASHIIADAMTPAFRRGDYAGGLNAAVDQLGARIRGEPLPPVTAPSRGAAPDDPNAITLSGWQAALLIMLIIVPIAVLIGLIGGVLLRGLIGRNFGALVAGVATGGLLWLLIASAVIAIAGGLLALLIALGAGLMASAPAIASLGRGGRTGGPVFLPDSGGFGRSLGRGGFGGGDWGGNSGGGGFSSGGGGDFGGGGASGNW